MKYILIITMIFNVCFGQKLQPVKIDKLTGDTSIGTETVTLFRKVGAGRAGEKLESLAYKSKGNTFLMMVGRTGKTDAFSFDEGDELSLKLSDNSVVSLKAIQSSIPKTELNPFGQYWNTVYLLDQPAVNKILHSEVVYIRLSHSTGYFEYDIKDKMTSLIGKCVELVSK